MVVEHEPSWLQQEPEGGCGQGLAGWQDAPCVQTVFDAVHWNCAFCVQAPEAVLQQVPVGGTKHVFGWQTPALVHVLGAGQLA
jgi:hypothetical protein